MRKFFFLVLLNSFMFGSVFSSTWEYLVYIQSSEWNKKTKSIDRVVILATDKLYAGGTASTIQEATAIALKKYDKSFNAEKGFTTNVLSSLGKNRWELVQIVSEKNDNTFYFKRAK